MALIIVGTDIMEQEIIESTLKRNEKLVELADVTRRILLRLNNLIGIFTIIAWAILVFGLILAIKLFMLIKFVI